MCDWCGSVIISIKRIDVWLCVVVFMISFRCSIIFSFYTSHVHGTVKCMHFLTFFGCFASVFFITFSLKIDERLLNPFSQACDIVESKKYWTLILDFLRNINARTSDLLKEEFLDGINFLPNPPVDLHL